MRGLLSWLVMPALFLLGTSARADDCEKLLVPDFALPAIDTTTDLTYLAAVTAETFPAHKANAMPKLAHIGILLPMASQLLQYAKSYDDFASGREQKYTQYGFSYPLADLAAYYRRLLPASRLDTYTTCTGATGLLARVVKSDRDFVELEASWRAPAAGPAQVKVGNFAVTGATLMGAAPKSLQVAPSILVFVRTLDADLRWSANIGGRPESIWVPRFVAAPERDRYDAAPCADAAQVVHALLHQILERDARPAEVRVQAELLKRGSNNVRQLAERLVLSDEYQKKFVRGKELETVLESLYTHVLARASDAKGLAANKSRFRDAAFMTMAPTFFQNVEYAQRFGAWVVPGPTPGIAFCPAEK